MRVQPSFARSNIASHAAPVARPNNDEVQSNVTRCQLPITPRNEKHLNLLEKCAGYRNGAIQIDLDPMFWNWLKFVDPSIVAQAYVDAVLISGGHPSEAANSIALLRETGEQKSKAELEKIASEQKNARAIIDELKLNQESKRFKLGLHVPKAMQMRYVAATNPDANLRADYVLHIHSLDFQKMLTAFSDLPSEAQGQQGLQEMIAKNPQQTPAIVIALKRLYTAWGR
jgi:hypothetical protein